VPALSAASLLLVAQLRHELRSRLSTSVRRTFEEAAEAHPRHQLPPLLRVPGAGSHTASRRHRRKERFTTLFHHLSPEMLRKAFFALRREAAAGVLG
jgi:hypothetical protein